MQVTHNKPARQPIRLGVANFKAFGPNLQNIALKPITLVFGPNSGGKSSLLHYMLWLKDVISPPAGTIDKLDIYRPTAGDAPADLSGAGQGVDLGGFKQFRHGKDSQTEVKTKLSLSLQAKGREQPSQVEVTSFFAMATPATDYKARLRALVQERLQESIAKNSLQKLLENAWRLPKILLEDSLTKLLAKEYGESRLKNCLEDLIDERDGQFPPLSQLMAEASPRLFELHEQTFPGLAFLDDLLGDKDSSTVQEEMPVSAKEPLTEGRLLSELQNLACRVFDELGHEPPSRPENASPALVRFEIETQGTSLLVASRDAASRLVVEHLDLMTLATLLPSAYDQGKLAELQDAFTSNKSHWSFTDVSTWLPGGLHLDDGSFTTKSESAQGLFSLIEGTEEVPGLLLLCSEAAKEQFEKLSYLGPIRAYPSREIKASDLPQHKDSHGWFAWRRLSKDVGLRQRVNQWLKDENRATDENKATRATVEVLVDEQLALGAVREAVTQEMTKIIEAERKELTADEELAENGNGKSVFGLQYWDEQRAIQSAFEIASSRLVSESSRTVFLGDLKTGKQVSSRDIGVGISQLIPVLVQAMGSEEEVILMEQPELHLHPRLQAELGDVFIKFALERGNTFVMETHSEHLILRVLRRIRETTRNTLPDGACPIKPGDVSVLYVQPGENGSTVQELRIDEQGRFRDNWPQGFFEDRLDEMF